MQARRKWRRRRIIVKDRSVIQRDAPWQACGQEGTSKQELIGFHGRICRIETRIALDLETTHYIENGDQADVFYSRHVHAVLSIEFLLLMGCAFRLDQWSGQVTMLLIATREFLGAQQRCDEGTAGQGVICPAGINP